MIASKIKSLRKSASLTQEEMAKILGCSVATICGYESGKVGVPYSSVKVYAGYFKCHIEYLLSDDIPLMDDPDALEKNPYITKIPVLKNLAAEPVGNNIYKRIYHPFFDNAPKRKAWLMPDKDGSASIAIIMEVSTPREGDHVAIILDGKTTSHGYYYIDDERRVCIKTKKKGNKGIRNIRVGLNPEDKIAGVIELVIS